MSQSQSLKAKMVTASRTPIKQKCKNFENESASCILSFPSSKNMLPSQKGNKSKFFHHCAFSEGKEKKKSRLEFSLKLASPFHSLGLRKSFLEVNQTILHSLSSAVSRRQQNKVIVDINHGDVKGGHFVDTE